MKILSLDIYRNISYYTSHLMLPLYRHFGGMKWNGTQNYLIPLVNKTKELIEKSGISQETILHHLANDSRPEIEVTANDLSSVNVNQLGTYDLSVTATDSFSNTASKVIKVDVVDDEAPKFKVAGVETGYVVQVPINGSQDISSYVTASDNVDGDVMINESEDVQVNEVYRAFNLHDILLAHLVALGILDDRDTAV